MICNSEALYLDLGNNSADKYREFIKKLNNIVEHRNDRYKKELIYETDYLKNSHSNNCPVYNILSIDGGGTRGVLPALWLRKIKYRTHRPISHLFNMIARTSTGTGRYLTNPSNPDQSRNLLFWAQNLPRLMLSAQEGNTDHEMYNQLNNRYQRWQVFFEKPIKLDEHESIPYLLELGYQYIEELDCSDENPINALVESFDP
ncbi:hypothetical protein C2G38_2030896 [Gigaspora rosea]|uniref:PNPLA domain-containing protein n=1 Tax=Gigaspora rosea TaxID=44941 RepID=A0A397W2P4_9GLOM|nr:hypothetical protein C2G38_2030896 [Gigaspora rosea]